MHIRTQLSLAALVTLTLISAPCAAQSVTTYGQVRLTVNQIKTGNAATVRELRDNASRLGFRGTEDLGGGLEALFGLETGFGSDTGDFGNPVFRNSYVALRGGMGTVALGRLDSGNPTGSPLYSQFTSMTHFAPNDAGATATSTSMFNARNRTSNSIGYSSPKLGNASLRVRTYYRGAGTATELENSARSTDVGLNYDSGPFKAALGWAQDTRQGGLRNNEFDDKWQAGVSYQATQGLDVYLFAGRDRFRNTATTRRDVNYKLLGAAYRVGVHKVVFNVMQRDVQASLAGKRNRQQVSYQYFLSKRTELQFFIDNDGIDSSKSNVRVRAIGTGIRHDF